MGILKIVLKNGNSQFFYVKSSKKLGIPMSSLPLQPKSA